MELVAGCYEQVLFGFAVHREPEASGALEQWTPVADFTHHAHTASLSAVAVSSRFVVTGSRDETIHIYDMKTKTEHGALVHHSGTITCLKFYGNRHLISGAEDGLICIWDTKKWECLKSIRAHRGHVTFLSIHPSGKLALSVGTDKTLRTWNLVDGRSAFVKNIKQNAHIVEWSPKGEKYVVVTGNKVDIYLLDTASVSGTLTNEKRVSSVAFLSESVLAVAGDEEVVRLFDCDSLLCLCEFRAHENRVKDMLSFEVPEHRVMVTASSDGFLRMWKLSHDKAVPPSLLCEVNTKARLTCLGVWLDRQTDTKKSLPPAAKPCPVSKEQSRSPQKESGGEVQKEEKPSERNAERGGLPGESSEPERERPVAPRKRKGDLPGEGGKRKTERSLVAPGNRKGGLPGEGGEPKREKSLIAPRKRKGGLSGEGSEPERERSLVAPKKRKGGLPGDGSEPERERSLLAPKKRKTAKMFEKKKKKKKI